MAESSPRRKASHRQLPPETVELIAQRFKALSEPVRLRLVMALEGGEQTVGQLVTSMGATQTAVSRHLQALARAGVVARRKEGNHAYYGIADPAIFELCDQVCGSIARAFERQAKSARWLR